MYNFLPELSYLWSLLQQKRWERFYNHYMGLASRKEAGDISYGFLLKYVNKDIEK